MLNKVEGQNIGISESGNQPHSSAILDIVSKNKGILIPRMTKDQREGISDIPKGLFVFDNTSSTFWYHNEFKWVEIDVNSNSGSSHQTLFHNGLKWVPTSNLSNDGLTVKSKNDMSINGLTVGLGNGNITSNTVFGKNSLNQNTSGSHNVGIGLYTLSQNTSGSHNVAISSYSLYSNEEGSSNLAIGLLSLWNNTKGSRNIALGFAALEENTFGSDNIAIGHRSNFSYKSGNNNISLGFESMGNTEGSNNLVMGNNAMKKCEGSNNIAIGNNVMFDVEGNNNICIGKDAMNYASNIHNSIGIGNSAYCSGDNSISIGNGASSFGDNKVVIGNYTVTSVGSIVQWSTSSDRRYKTKIKENVRGLDFIKKLRPVTYYLDMDAIAKFNNTPDSVRLKKAEKNKGSILQTGFIAQEVDSVAKELGFDFSGVDGPQNEKDAYGLRYAVFVVPLVKAVQEQQELIEKLEIRIRELEK